MQIIELYEKLNFKFGSCTIEYKKNAKGDYKKHPNYNVEKDGKKSYNWKDPIYNEKYNGLYIVTGEDSGIVVVDLDNMEKEENKEIYSEGIKSSNMIIKTRKGYHIYYRYTDEYDRTIHCKSKEFDILSTGSHVYGAPTHYVDENNNKIEYKVDIIPKDKLNNMSKKMKDLINSYLMEPLESHNNATKKVINKELRETDKQISFESVTSREIVLNILDNIDEQRADDFRYWIMIGYALKNGGYGYELWDKFSQRSKRHEEGICKFFYDRMVKKNYDMITVATLWYWLKIDYPDKFRELQCDKILKGYDESMDKIAGNDFDSNLMIRLLDEDIRQFKGKYDMVMDRTRSFKYFNHYHCYVEKMKTYFVKEYDGGRYKLSKLDDIEGTYPDIEMKGIEFATKWIKHKKRAKFSYYNFVPYYKDNGPKDNTLNIFTDCV